MKIGGLGNMFSSKAAAPGNESLAKQGTGGAKPGAKAQGGESPSDIQGHNLPEKPDQPPKEGGSSGMDKVMMAGMIIPGVAPLAQPLMDKITKKPDPISPTLPGDNPNDPANQKKQQVEQAQGDAQAQVMKTMNIVAGNM